MRGCGFKICQFYSASGWHYALRIQGDIKVGASVYRYGHRWYEVHLHEISDLALSEYKIPGESCSLLDFIVREVQKPAPP